MIAQRSQVESRRGFALAVVLVLILTVSIIIAGVLQRYSALQRTVQRQVAEYRMHHEMFGVQAMAMQWLARHHEALRARWFDAPTLAEQKKICEEMQLLAFEEVPYIPLGQSIPPTAYRNYLTGVLSGHPFFWNVRRTTA